MPALPPAADFTASTVTEGQFKTALTSLRGFLSGVLGTTGVVQDALTVLGALAGTYLARSTAYTLAVTDRGKLIDATGTWTLSLPAAATAGAGFSFLIRNLGAGTITIDPSGAELIDGSATIPVAVGQGGIVMSTGTAWVTTGALGGIGGTGAVQSTASDATAGRLLKVGAFGLGGTVLTSEDWIALANSGLFRNTTTGATGVPSALTNWNLLHLHTGATLAHQIAVRSNAMAYRRILSGVGETWRVLFDRLNILGAVSQTAGEPTGALIERGTSASGEYVKLADGTLICTRNDLSAANANTADGNIFRSASVTWTFPATFIAAPAMSGAVDDIDCWISAAAPVVGSCSFRVKSSVTKGSALNFRAVAIGRWF
jgi:hypothetical protein